jgi:hypothetical protein
MGAELKRRAAAVGGVFLSWAITAGAQDAKNPANVPEPAPNAPAAAASARVHVFVDYSGAYIETRSSVDRGPWSYTCAAPCDRTLLVEDMQIRVRAPGMTPSNHFRIEPGPGTARLRVSGGSAAARTWGIIGLAGGIPLSLGGAALFGFGTVDDRDDARTVGAVALAVGTVAVVAALPLLLVGSTRVRDARGATVARQRPTAGAF